MGTVTLSGFNNIDFSSILEAVMQVERQPVTLLQAEQTALNAQKTAFGAFASKLGALESAAEALAAATAFDGTKTTVSDTSRLTASGGAGAPEGTYEIYVDQLARSQVTTASTTYANTDQAIVADGGTLTIGGVNVAISGPTTLQGLADAINGTANMSAAASVVRDTSGKYQLVLTGRQTGVAHAFTVTNNLTNSQGTVMAFNATNVQAARDAQVRINGVTATNDSNAFDGLIPNLAFTALKEDVQNPVTVTITASNDSVKSLIGKLVASFNDINSWLDAQTTAAAKGETNNIGRDALVRGMRAALSNVMTSNFGGTVQTLSEVGFSFERTGELSFDESAFDTAVSNGKTDVKTLFRGSNGTGGAFGTLVSTIQQYTAAGGLVPNARARLDAQVTKVGQRITDLEARLAIRREALQREYTAADLAIAQLNSSRSQLGSIGGSFGSL